MPYTTFIDDFEDGIINTDIYDVINPSGTSVAESGGKLICTPATNKIAGVVVKNPVKLLAEVALSIDVYLPSAPSGKTVVYISDSKLLDGSAPTRGYMVSLESSGIKVYKNDGSGWVLVGTVSYGIYPRYLATITVAPAGSVTVSNYGSVTVPSPFLAGEKSYIYFVGADTATSQFDEVRFPIEVAEQPTQQPAQPSFLTMNISQFCGAVIGLTLINNWLHKWAGEVYGEWKALRL